jgi:repressor LexA
VKLTPKQQRTLEFIAHHIETHRFPPSLRQICDEFQIRTQAAHDRIRMLVKQGAITKQAVIARGLAITEAGRVELGRLAYERRPE